MSKLYVFDETIYTTCNYYRNFDIVTVFNKTDEWLLNKNGINTTFEPSDVAVNSNGFNSAKLNVNTLKSDGLIANTKLKSFPIMIIPTTLGIPLNIEMPKFNQIYNALGENVAADDVDSLIKFYTLTMPIKITVGLKNKIISTISNLDAFIDDYGIIQNNKGEIINGGISEPFTNLFSEELY